MEEMSENVFVESEIDRVVILYILFFLSFKGVYKIFICIYVNRKQILKK